MAPSTDTLIVGIDFGTTYSGVAAVYGGQPEKPDEIEVIKSWPGGGNGTREKVPSEIAYGDPLTASDERKLLSGGDADDDIPNPRGKTTTTNRKRKASDEFDLEDVLTPPTKKEKSKGKGNKATSNMRWGYQVRQDEQRLRCLKLLLDPEQNFPDYVSLDDIKQQLATTGKSVNTVIAEYLKALFDHTKEALKRRYNEYFVSKTPLQVVLTVPAVWSDKAQEATLAAAKDAGIGDQITMISEPEAAAVYALQAIQPNDLSVGQNFVVVDAGGGTVDLITYSIQGLNPLRLEEVLRGSGGCCGAAFLNLAFEKFVQKKLGNKAFIELRLNKPQTWLTALKCFEDSVKVDFNPADDTVFFIPLPGVMSNARAGIERGFLRMSHVYELGQKVHALILVGGFGQSEFLATCLRKRFTERAPAIEVLQPVHARTAVVRGAVLRGLEGKELVLSRKARRHYGVVVNRPFDEKVHSDSVKYWDDFESCWKAKDQMRWYIRKGDTIPSDAPVLFSFYRCFELNDRKEANHALIVCDDDNAPSQCEASTRSICVMQSDLEDVPAHLWRWKRSSKGPYKKLSFEMGMQIQSGGLRFDLRVDNVTYGKVTTAFD
ncbi:actin-like ATPase domain-containing protein [Hortaea werneckii]|nr:actin-like ATPase domain-containing protein [Hortaea werneckii]